MFKMESELMDVFNRACYSFVPQSRIVSPVQFLSATGLFFSL